ncbi:lipopolysaccharide transport periplasmic protein LptA [Halovulum dunhuangense]|uniref:Lipopolysaccharide transport periplasmic protein LptA n=2 Tax=Halovulum dunhuangense TaxID=1505036 RepID=A0A849KQN3_9RHOB|nr:lipopolysaccharide transport periplasmic protein LptA [Halovulum dunhuangense]
MGRIATAVFLTVLALPGAALAQATLPFGGFVHDSSLPVEIAADSLTLDQSDGSAIFEGTVEVAQGTLRMQADRIAVFYAEGGAQGGEVARMEARGNVLLTNGAEAAEAQEARYDVSSGEVAMSGDVLLTQGENVLAGQALRIDLTTGTARMEGRVQTVLNPRREP